MASEDCYVDVLSAAEEWQVLTEKEDEPTDAEYDEAHDGLAEAVEALRELEASEGTAVRDEPWGGTRLAMIGVLDAANAWYTMSSDEDPDETEADAILGRLSEAVQALRVAEETRVQRLLRGEYDQLVQRSE